MIYLLSITTNVNLLSLFSPSLKILAEDIKACRAIGSVQDTMDLQLFLDFIYINLYDARATNLNLMIENVRFYPLEKNNLNFNYSLIG